MFVVPSRYCLILFKYEPRDAPSPRSTDRLGLVNSPHPLQILAAVCHYLNWSMPHLGSELGGLRFSEESFETARGVTKVGGRGGRMWNRRIVQVAVAAGSIALISGLFTGDVGAAPSKASYNLQVGAICRGYQQKLQAVGSTLSSDSTPQQLAAELKSTIPMDQKGISRMKKIPQPKAEGRRLKAVFTTQRIELERFKKLDNDIKEGNGDAVRVLIPTLSSVVAKLKKQYDMAGLTECAVETPAAPMSPAP